VKSLILQTTTRLLITLLLLFSLFLLLRGHNAPGGGFVGGLVVGAAFILYVYAYDVGAGRKALWFEPRTLIATGLTVAATSAVPAALLGRPFMTGLWGTLGPEEGGIHIGTPMVFDVGVYLVVVGVTLSIVFSLAEE
jgi:multicomponent Na+:H+ antiporter subunit B